MVARGEQMTFRIKLRPVSNNSSVIKMDCELNNEAIFLKNRGEILYSVNYSELDSISLIKYGVIGAVPGVQLYFNVPNPNFPASPSPTFGMGGLIGVLLSRKRKNIYQIYFYNKDDRNFFIFACKQKGIKINGEN